MKELRKIFITGLLVLIPIVGTLALIFWLLNTIDSIFREPLERIIGFPLIGIGVIITITLTILTGIFATNFFGNRIIGWSDNVMRKIPIVKPIYISIKQMIDTVFTNQRNAFKSVVLVQYPSNGIYTLGFITSDAPTVVKDKTGKNLKSVFIPTTPNPTSGMLVMFPEEDIIYLSLSIESGIKLIVSGGILLPEEHAGTDHNKII